MLMYAVAFVLFFPLFAGQGIDLIFYILQVDRLVLMPTLIDLLRYISFSSKIASQALDDSFSKHFLLASWQHIITFFVVTLLASRFSFEIFDKFLLCIQVSWRQNNFLFNFLNETNL